MNSRDYYEMLGVDQNATREEIEQACQNFRQELYYQRATDAIDANQFSEQLEDLEDAEEILLDEESRKEYDRSIAPSTKKGIGKAILAGAVAVTVAVSLLAAPKLVNTLKHTGGDIPAVTYETGTYADEQKDTAATSADATEETETATEEQTEEKEEYRPEVQHYGDINDEALVKERATTLVNELNALNIINPSTGTSYTVDEIVNLILYVNGVYTPETMEEIDVMHLNLLNLLISPLNTDPYLYHVVYASGNDDFKDIALEAVKDIKPVNFAGALAEYGTNGVYPLTQWMQQKREQIYSTTDRNEINKIYIEVGQVMADIMKGNGCTITIYDDKQEFTYTYTSEQILANHASAMLLTTDAQLIFANHYEIRDENDKVIDSVQSTWEVYNKFNGDEPDHVTLDEIQAWINNGCDYEWGIDSVLIDGQTFGQRIQGDLEGMAQNNYAMSSGTKLTK